MHVTSIKLENFRNIEKLNITPSKKVNLIYGNNGHGKTNLIEAMWLSTGLKNFRYSKTKDFLNFDKDFFKISLDYQTKNREENIKINYKKNGRILDVYKNGVKKINIPSLAGGFLGVVFSPDYLELVNGSPEGRRTFLNYAIGQLKPHYIDLISKYEKTLNQRNALLRNIKYTNDKLMLQVWDESLAGFGASIIEYRYDYILLLKKYAKSYYKGISDNKEELSITYNSSIKFDKSKNNIKDIYNKYIEELSKSLNEDIRLGFTAVGIHRDDLNISLNKKQARMFGSQGQKRSCVLSLKLAESAIIETIKKESPVVFLDDVLSELDEKRQSYILNNLNDKQIFITSCDKNLFKTMKKDKIFYMENGKINI